MCICVYVCIYMCVYECIYIGDAYVYGNRGREGDGDMERDSEGAKKQKKKNSTFKYSSSRPDTHWSISMDQLLNPDRRRVYAHTYIVLFYRVTDEAFLDCLAKHL